MNSPEHLVLVTLDCVRPDHLGCYGYGEVETPHLDALAMEGVLFEQAVTHAPNTWVAHASILTGTNPYRHGIRSPHSGLMNRVRTLAERLSAAGYRTAGFPGNTLVGRALGFHRGFQYFDEDHFEESFRVKDVVWRSDWKGAFERAHRWILEGDGPFFLWLHYIDTHHLPEFHLPEYFRKRYPPDYQYYDGKISYADEACIGALRRALQSMGIEKKTLLVVLADHGEELCPMEGPRHDNGLKDEVMRIPLILSGPGLSSCRKRIAEQVRGVDVLPTVLDLLGIPTDPSDSPIDGVSLLPLMGGDLLRKDDEAMAYMENLPRERKAVRTEEWKLIVRVPSNGHPLAPVKIEGLYHLPMDPKERKDLAPQRPAVVDHLMERLRSLALAEEEDPGDPVFPDESERERIESSLRALGYLE